MSDRLFERRAARQAAARRIADARLAAGSSPPGHVDELRGQERGSPAGSENPSTQLSTVSRRNGRKGNAGLACCAAEKSAKRSGIDGAGKLGRAADDEPVRRDERGGVALERLADRRRLRRIPEPVLAARVPVERLADRRRSRRPAGTRC